MANIERSLAHIEIIKDITPLEGYDRVALATILGWKVIVNKEELHVGDKCVYFEIDSLVNPSDERFSFMEKRKYKVKTLRMCRTISQGLAMPLSQFPELGDLDVGTDVTEKLKVTYYDPEDRQRKSSNIKIKDKSNILYKLYPNLFKKKFFKWLMKKKLGKKFIFFVFGGKIHQVEMKSRFPLKIVNTDETRIENIPFVLEGEKNKSKCYSVTEKCFSARMPVLTIDGQKRIGTIVNNDKENVLVASYNFETEQIEYSPVINRFRTLQNDNTKHYIIKASARVNGNRPKNIECTEDHLFFSDGIWKKASELKVGDILSHYSECVPQEAFEMILGSLLGDASINHRYEDRYIGVQFNHCIDQLEYYNYKRKIMGKYVGQDRVKISGYGSKMHSCVTRANPHINEYIKKNCLINGKKTITKQWCDDLTPLSLAFWYMDDGTLSNRNKDRYSERISFATNSFSVEECNLLQSMLLNKYGIDSTIHNKPSYKGNVIYLGVEGSKKFCSLIAPYVCNSMKYKLPKRFENMPCVLEEYEPQYSSAIINTEVVDVIELPPKKLGKYMYNIETKNHNYFVNKILVHNCDGTSTTFFLEKYKGKYEFGVCSRNVRQLDPDQETYFTTTSGLSQNVYWEMAFKYNIKDKLIDIAEKTKANFLYLQGETIGQKLQGNPYKLNDRQFYAFNLVIDDKRYENNELFEICDKYDIPHVPLIFDDHSLPDTMDELKLEATDKSVLNKSVLREGLVYREIGNSQFSFKNVSREYLLKHS